MSSILPLLAYGDTGWGDELLAGVRVTVLLSLATMPVALLGGFALAGARRARHWGWRLFGDAFATVFKGLPELLTLLIIYFGGSMLLQRLIGLFGGGYVEISAFLAGVIALGCVSASFASEVFMSAIAAVPKGQAEAGRALGLRPRHILWKITLPQILRIALPGLGNLWLVLLKDTALVSVIALPDLLRETQVAVGATKQPFVFFAVALLIYLVLSLVSTVLLLWLEARLGRSLAVARK